MRVITCDNCRAKNRVPGFRLSARATCGKCGVFLAEPRWLTAVRDVRLVLRTHWVVLVGALIVVAALLVVPLFQEPRKTAMESGWAAPPVVPVQTLAVAASSPQLAPASSAPIGKPKVPLMTCVPVSVKSGERLLYSKASARVPLKITTPAGDNFLFKLVLTGTKKVVMTAYVAGGDTQTFRVPDGTYSIYFAQGNVWCGFKEAFGKDNTKLLQLTGEFTFTSTVIPGVGTHYEGEEIDVSLHVDGNLESHEVSDAEFSDLSPAGPMAPDGEKEQLSELQGGRLRRR